MSHENGCTLNSDVQGRKKNRKYIKTRIRTSQWFNTNTHKYKNMQDFC